MDVPILLQNYLVKMNRLPVLSQLGSVVLGKTLLLGGDFLLGDFIRGGGALQRMLLSQLNQALN